MGSHLRVSVMPARECAAQRWGGRVARDIAECAGAKRSSDGVTPSIFCDSPCREDARAAGSRGRVNCELGYTFDFRTLTDAS